MQMRIHSARAKSSRTAANPKSSAKPAGKASAEMDDETKKALIELQKAQLERSLVP